MYARASTPIRLSQNPGSVPRDDRGLDIAVAVQHVMENLLQPGKWRFAGNVIGRSNLLFGDQREGSAHSLRRVMEGGFQRDLRIVQPVGVELYFRAAGATTKKVYRPAFAHHVNGHLPGFRTSHRLDHY